MRRRRGHRMDRAADPAGIGRGGGVRAPAFRVRQRGFTLIEVLLATALLAAGLLLAFATLRGATAAATRGEAIAERNQRIRAVEGFLRRRIGASLRIAFAQDQDGNGPIVFEGDGEGMRFVADLPDYLGRGGPHLHEVAVVGDGDARRIDIGFAVAQAGEVYREQPPRPPEVLADGLASVRLRYRGMAEGNVLGDWQDAWQAPGAMPVLVSVEIADAQGPWPPLVVSLAYGSGERSGRRTTLR